MKSALSGERPAALPHRLASRQIGPAARPAGMKIRAGLPKNRAGRPAGRPAGRRPPAAGQAQIGTGLDVAGARPGAGPGGQGAGRAAGPRFKWTAMVADIGRHRLWHGRAALQRAGGAAAAGQRPAGRKSSRPSGRPGGWPGPAKRPAARPAARSSPLCGMRGQLEIGLTGVIFAHFFCGGRVRSTFPAAPLPSAACPGSPWPAARKSHHLPTTGS